MEAKNKPDAKWGALKLLDAKCINNAIMRLNRTHNRDGAFPKGPGIRQSDGSYLVSAVQRDQVGLQSGLHGQGEGLVVRLGLEGRDGGGGGVIHHSPSTSRHIAT